MALTHEQKEDIAKNKDLAAASYVWILSVLILFYRRDSKFIQFHAKQGTFLFVLSVVFWVLPYVFYLNILVLAGMIVGFITALSGEYYQMPIIHAFITNKEKVKSMPGDIAYIFRHGWRRLKEIFHPPSDKQILKEHTEDRLREVEKQIQAVQKKLDGDMEELKNLKSELEDLKKKNHAVEKLHDTDSK